MNRQEIDEICWDFEALCVGLVALTDSNRRHSRPVFFSKSPHFDSWFMVCNVGDFPASFG